jgi:hypothetical protein
VHGVHQALNPWYSVCGGQIRVRTRGIETLHLRSVDEGGVVAGEWLEASGRDVAIAYPTCAWFDPHDPKTSFALAPVARAVLHAFLHAACGEGLAEPVFCYRIYLCQL